MIEIVLLIILMGVAVFVVLFVSWYSVPENEVMERWAETNPQAVKEYQDQNWYYGSLSNNK